MRGLVITAAAFAAGLALGYVIWKEGGAGGRAKDNQNVLINGGFGPPGCIPCTDPEPHTTFSITLSESFFDEIG